MKYLSLFSVLSLLLFASCDGNKSQKSDVTEVGITKETVMEIGERRNEILAKIGDNNHELAELVNLLGDQIKEQPDKAEEITLAMQALSNLIMGNHETMQRIDMFYEELLNAISENRKRDDLMTIVNNLENDVKNGPAKETKIQFYERLKALGLDHPFFHNIEGDAPNEGDAPEHPEDAPMHDQPVEGAVKVDPPTE